MNNENLYKVSVLYGTRNIVYSMSHGVLIKFVKWLQYGNSDVFIFEEDIEQPCVTMLIKNYIACITIMNCRLSDLRMESTWLDELHVETKLLGGKNEIVQDSIC